MKKFISILLTASMLASIAAMAASAETTEVVSSEQETASDESTTEFTEETIETNSSDEETTEESNDFIFGDANSDGVIDAKDATIVLKDYAEVLCEHESILSADTADINQDGIINSTDASYILQYAAFCIVKGDNICTLKEFPTSKERHEFQKELAYEEYLKEYSSLDFDTFSGYYDEYVRDNPCMTDIEYAEYRYYCDNYDPNVDPDEFLHYASVVAQVNGFIFGYDVIGIDELDTLYEFTTYLSDTYGFQNWEIDKNFKSSTDYQNFLKTRETK